MKQLFARSLKSTVQHYSKQVFTALLMVMMISACSLMGPRHINVGSTLDDLPEIELPSDIDPAPVESIVKIEQSYRAALEVAESPEVRHKILVRLADLEMATSEDRQLTQLEEKQHFSDAIAMYDELLQLNETQTDKTTDERLLYRLSKAYALDGRMDESDKALARLVKLYPDSPLAAEVEFRRAEHAFTEGYYKASKSLYAQVVAAGESTPFYLNAVYMHGWSLFKANEFEQAVGSFTEVLDRLLVPKSEGLNPDDKVKGGQSLIDDTLRVMALTFTYLDGAKSITSIYSGLGERPYQHLLYEQLGTLHFEKQRYQDAADTYRHYIQQFPTSDYGPEFTVKMIDVFKQGGFPEQILPAKENFVINYSLGSAYWASRSIEQQQALIPHLDSFLDELSSYYHAEGQALKSAAEKYNTQGQRPKVRPQAAAPKFLKAANYYDQYIALFPKSDKVGEMSYLKAEAYYEAGELSKAISAYEVVAYQLLDSKRGASAGYSAILGISELLNAEQEPIAIAELKAQKIQNALSFADYYPNDPNAIVVLTQTAQEVFNSGDQSKAVEIAQRITQWQPQPAANLRKTAWLILAHNQFDQQEFSQAEASYRQVLALLEPTASDKPSIIERIAASMYKAAEQKVAAGEVELAIDQLLSINTISSGSEIAMKAHYSAGNHLIDLKQWARAESVFMKFSQLYASDPLALTLAPKFVLIYQELKQWDKAAAVLAQMSRTANTPEERRQALYLSAELYQKSGRLADATARYSDYVRTYPKPFDLATEARFQLLELAKTSGDNRAYRRWLDELISADRKAGKDRTARSRYLAAFASNFFANETYISYERIKLNLPIKKSLKTKKKALKATLDAYKAVLDYGVAEFATEANYRIGNVYSQLSRDLLDSERPKGLDDLALEQYEILLEDLAYPFEEKSVDLLAANAERAWTGLYDDWVKRSFDELAKILPARYGKQEKKEEVSRGVH